MKVLLDLIISSIRFQKNESVLDIFPTDFCDKIDVIYFMGEITLKKDNITGGDSYATRAYGAIAQESLGCASHSYY